MRSGDRAKEGSRRDGPQPWSAPAMVPEGGCPDGLVEGEKPGKGKDEKAPVDVAMKGLPCEPFENGGMRRKGMSQLPKPWGQQGAAHENGDEIDQQ